MNVFKIPPIGGDLPGHSWEEGRSWRTDLANLHRYLFASQFSRAQEILTIASGQGLGAFLLSQVAARVTGVNIDAADVERTNKLFGFDRLSFVEGSYGNLPVPDDSFDVVICLETAIGVSEYEKLLYEVRRVLRREGLFIVSTPNREASAAAEQTIPATFTKSEFLHLLSQFFSRTHLGLQKITSASVTLPYRPASIRTEIFHRLDAQTIEATDALSNASHLVGIASNAALPTVQWGVLVDDQILETLQDQVARCDVVRLEKLEGDLAKANETTLRLVEEVEEGGRRLQEIGLAGRQFIVEIENRNQQLVLANQSLRLCEETLDLVRRRLHAIESSTSWRLMKLVQRSAQALGLVRPPK